VSAEERNKVTGVALCGVGGQGVVLLSDIFSEGLMEYGFDVKKTEQHGMSQRNGSVNAQIKYGAKVYAPVLATGTADIIVAFEKAEALRWLRFLRPGGCLLVNNWEIAPIEAQIGQIKYPENLNERFRETVPGTILVDAANIAGSLGSARAQSMLLLGVMVNRLNLDGYDWENRIAARVPPNYVEVNLATYRRGLEIGSSEK
jgi:indolepyruvate ferredoxin oxidoreductase beta subunit